MPGAGRSPGRRRVGTGEWGVSELADYDPLHRHNDVNKDLLTAPTGHARAFSRPRTAGSWTGGRPSLMRCERSRVL